MSPADPTVVVDATVATGTDVIADGVVVLAGGAVAWVGGRDALPAEWRSAEPYSVGGRLVTPGLVESHAQLVFAGEGAPESVPALIEATTAADADALFESALRRAWWFVRNGVTTLELKVGAAVEPEEHLRQLAVAARLREALPIATKTTLQVARAYPDDEEHEDYILRICDELLPAAMAQGGFDFFEVYCEETDGLSMEDSSTILETVYRKKFPTRVSADRLSDSAGGALAPAFYAKSAAYLNYTDDIAVKAMANAGTVAVLAPGASLGETQRPPVKLLRERGVPMAVSTGFGPLAPALSDPRTAAQLATVLFGLTPDEALRGITSVAARAIGADGAGTLSPSGPGDLAVWDAGHPHDLVHWGSGPACHEVWSGGVRVPGE